MARRRPQKKDNMIQWIIGAVLVYIAFLFIKTIPTLNGINQQAASLNNVVQPASNIIGTLSNLISSFVRTTGITQPTNNGLNNAAPSYFNTINSGSTPVLGNFDFVTQSDPFGNLIASNNTVKPNGILNTFDPNGSSLFTMKYPPGYNQYILY